MVQKKDNKSDKYLKQWYQKIIYVNAGITALCFILFLSLSIGFNDYSYIYGALISLPSSWFLVAFYWMFYKNITFAHNRAGLSTYKTTIRFTMMFVLKSIVVFLPLVVVMILFALDIQVFNIWSVITCTVLTPLIFFFMRFFMVEPKTKKGGGQDN